MGFLNIYPTENDVKRKLYSCNMIILEEKFQEAKAKLRKYLKENNDVVLRDHCYWTGKGTANQQCNIMYRKIYNIPCFFHNFTGYDSHHIFQNISSLEKAHTVVSKSLEKFTSMNIGPIRIQDSLQFLNYSLDKLVSNLKDKGLKDNKSLKDTFPIVYTSKSNVSI